MEKFGKQTPLNSLDRTIEDMREDIEWYEDVEDEERVLELEAELRALEKGEDFDAELFWEERRKKLAQTPTPVQYEYFNRGNDYYRREDIFEYAKGMSEYALEKGIHNIIFMDKSARPAWIGVDEYWNNRMKDTPKPNFYFMAPRGFMTKEFFEKASKDSRFAAGTLYERKNSDDEAREQLRTRYKKLMLAKNEPILLFDTCSHSGDSLSSVKRILELEGFTDVRTASATMPDEKSTAPSVIYFDDNGLELCLPFGRDLAVQTDLRSVNSTPSYNKLDVAQGKNIRNDIRKIIQEHL